MLDQLIYFLVKVERNLLFYLKENILFKGIIFLNTLSESPM